MAGEAAGLFLDYSKNRIVDQTIKLLLQLANESCLRERIARDDPGQHRGCALHRRLAQAARKTQ